MTSWRPCKSFRSSTAALTKGRKSDNPIIFGYQGKAQLEVIYGHLAEVMLSQPASKFVLKTAEPKAAKWASELIGDIEIERVRETVADGKRAGKSFTMDRQIEPLVMSSEIAGLEDLHAFLKLGNNVTRFSFPHMDRPLIAPSFVARDIPEGDMWLNPLAPAKPKPPASPVPAAAAPQAANPPVDTPPSSRRSREHPASTKEKESPASHAGATHRFHAITRERASVWTASDGSRYPSQQRPIDPERRTPCSRFQRPSTQARHRPITRWSSLPAPRATTSRTAQLQGEWQGQLASDKMSLSRGCQPRAFQASDRRPTP